MINTMLEVQTAMETHTENKSAGRNHEDYMEEETFRVKHKVSLVCQILQMAHSVPITTHVDSMTASQPCEVTVSTELQ